MIDENALEIRNDGWSTHHLKRDGRKGDSVIDPTLPIRPITNSHRLAGDHATGSDHKVIEWEVEVDRQMEADHERVIGWNLLVMMEKDAEAAEKLWTKLGKERAHLDTECTKDEVKQEAAWFQEAMNSSLDATAKKIRICAKSKRWWNADIKESRKAVGRKNRTTRNSE